MRLNWRPKRVAFLDFETQSGTELTTTHKYATAPDTKMLTCVVKTQEGEVHKVGPYLDQAGWNLLARIGAEYTLVAHNAVFDAAIWEHACKLPEAEWFDTLPCARAAGFPGKLDELSKALGGRGKDPMGRRLIELLCIVRNNKVPALGPAHKLLMDYNTQDVEELEFIYNKVKDFGEPDVMTVDRVINDRGVPIKRAFLEQLIDLYKQNDKLVRAEFDERTGGVSPTSAKQVKEWMKRMGFKVPVKPGEEAKESIGKFAMKAFMAKPQDFYCGDDSDESAAIEAMVEALELRKEVARVGKGKADAAFEGIEYDDRIREQFVYWGAHTGRWSGRKLQLHNMPQAVKQVKVRSLTDYAGVQEIARVASVEAGYRVGITDVLNAMLRHLVQADNLLVADYGGVEARGAAWVAGCDKMLELYSDPSKSVYIDIGSVVFGRRISKKGDPAEYALSKSLVLGCMYGMSGKKFEYTVKSRGTNVATFEKLGMSIADMVKMYRNTYPEIPQIWKAYGDTCLKAVESRAELYCGKCYFKMVGNDLHIVLPSGRPIVYRNARIELTVPGWQKLYNMPETPMPTVCYDSARGWRNFLYGSKITENVVQGICRDLLAYTLVCCEQEGLDPILHVHDEAVMQAPPSKFNRFMEIMSSGPAWAKGFPILVEGYSGPIWTKNPDGYEEMHSLGGKAIWHKAAA
jgi:DNA polymerase bacteriophage-type